MTPNNIYHWACAGIRLDLKLGRVTGVDGAGQRLSPVNLKLLKYLLCHQGEVVTRAELFDAVWPNQTVSDDVLTRAISDIRSQLTKLDTPTKFIETLPKRGYRWIEPANPVVDAEVSFHSPVSMPTRITAAESPLKTQRTSVKVLSYLLPALLLAALTMLAITQLAQQTSPRVAVLPLKAQPHGQVIAHQVDALLLEILRSDMRVNLLSGSAIASGPANPFPYFFNEFNARWVLEGRINNSEGISQLELSLVDARSGIEQRHVRVEAMSYAELRGQLAQQIGYLLADLESD